MSITHKMNPSPELSKAIEVYNNFWSNLCLDGASDLKDVQFDGAPIDLDALAYCEYELGFPDTDPDYKYASLIWAQVMVVSAEATWASSTDGNIAIEIIASDYKECIFFPHTHLLEILNGYHIQYDNFGILTDIFLLHAFCCEFSIEEVPLLSKLSFNYEYGSLQENMFKSLISPLKLLTNKRLEIRKAQQIEPEGGAYSDNAGR